MKDLRILLTSTGVSAEKFANLCGVSRATVYKWLNGTEPDYLREGRVLKVMGLMASARKSGTLPVDRELAVEKKISEVLLVELRKLSPPPQ